MSFDLLNFDVIFAMPMMHRVEKEIDGIRPLPMFISHVIVIELANNPGIEGESRIGHVLIRDVTISFLSLEESEMDAVHCRSIVSHPMFSPRVSNDESLGFIAVADG